MQVVVSISLQTCSLRSTPAPGTGPGCPEILRISSVAWLIGSLLGFLELYQETLKFRGIGVWVGYGWRQPIHDRSCVLTLVFLNAAITLMNGNSDLIGLLSINDHGLDTFGDKCLGDVVIACAGDFDFVPTINPQLLSQFDGNFYERLGDELD